MAIGYPKDKANIDAQLGDISSSLNRAFRRFTQLGAELNAYTDTQLTNAGYSAAEVTTLRSMITDMAQLNNIYTGAAALATAKDSRTNIRPLWGVTGDY
jgi:hypothetical protein